MELPRGINQNITCPVVENTKKGKGPTSSVGRPRPNYQLLMPYKPELTLAEVEKFWCLSALDKCHGNVSQASKLLGIGRETLYRKIRIWGGNK